MTDEPGPEDSEAGVLLDILPHGRSDAEEPQYRRSAVAYAVGEKAFTLYELTLTDDADLAIGDRIRIRPAFEDGVERGREIDYERLSDGAKSELEYVVEEIIQRQESEFVDFFNDAQPVTLRLHQLTLLPGIGEKLRDNILDERKRRPFESFEDLENRVSGLHDPMNVLVDRVFDEIQEAEDLKYSIFVRS